MYQITKKVEARIGEGEWQCEFVCDDETDVAKLPTSTTAGTGGKTAQDNHKCEAGSCAYIVDDNAEYKLYILNNQDEWVPQGVVGSGGSASSGGGSHEPCSWNDLRDKPFGVVGHSIEEAVFTGILDDYPCYTHPLYPDETYIKVSDNVYTADDFNTSEVSLYVNADGDIWSAGNNTFAFNEYFVCETHTDNIRYGDAIVVVVPQSSAYIVSCSKPATGDYATTKEPGTYFVYRSIGDRVTYVVSVSCVKKETETIQTLDPKYLPYTRFDLPFNVTSGGFVSFVPLSKVQTALDNNLVMHIIYGESISGGYATYNFALPFKDCLDIYVVSGYVYGEMSDGRIRVSVEFDAQDYVNGVLTVTRAQLYNNYYDIKKCYASTV